MHRIYLAFLVFFRVLFGKPLPAELLPPAPEPARLPPPAKEAAPEAKAPAEAKVERVARAPEARPAPAKIDVEPGALLLLALLQREGRLIDFLRESIDGYDDATVAGAAREIHRGCRKAIDEHFTFEPVVGGEENAPYTVEAGFDRTRVRVTGNVKGEPPFTGLLRHPGWKAAKVKLPQVGDASDLCVVAPAEVELE